MNKNDINLIVKNVWRIAKLILCVSMILSLILFLNGVSLETIYDIVITAVPWGIIYICWKSYVDIKKFNKLKRIKNYVSPKQFPRSTDAIELEYQRIICEIKEQNFSKMNQMEIAKKDMHDRYVTWMHNIKLPLTALQLMFENSELDGNELYQMQVQLNSIRSYLNEMLNFVALNNGDNDLKIEEVDTGVIIKDILKRNSWLIISKKQSLVLGENLPILISDKRWLEILLEQLIINASKYTKVDGKIYIESSEKNNIIIRDEGIGISAQDIQRIFETGFTGETGRTRMDATGLGLYIVGEISKKLDLEIIVKSKKGKGSSFIVTKKNN